MGSRDLGAALPAGAMLGFEVAILSDSSERPEKWLRRPPLKERVGIFW